MTDCIEDRADVVWTMDQIGDVRRLWVQARVDRSAEFATDGMASEVTKRQVAHQLCDAAQTFAVEADPRDVAFVEQTEPTHLVIEGFWRPATKIVELLGGPADGQVVEVARPFEPVRVLEPPDVSATQPDEAAAAAAVAFQSVSYELVGWRERGRRWVFQLVEPG